jgi:hypothetical protein
MFSQKTIFEIIIERFTYDLHPDAPKKHKNRFPKSFGSYNLLYL